MWFADRSLVGLLVLASCGDFVRYEGPHANAGRGEIDEETRRELENAYQMDHVLLEGVVASYTRASPDAQFVYVDYARLKRSPLALFALDQYLAALAVVKPENLMSRGERLSYWINGYNATVIRGVLERFDPETNLDYTVSDENFAFFRTVTQTFGGRSYSLDQVEHGIIRGDGQHPALANSDSEAQQDMRERHRLLWSGGAPIALIHVALNCGALGCPNLPSNAPFAYRPSMIDLQLEEMARTFVNNELKGAGPNGISRLFDWYAADWSLSFGTVAGFIESYRQDGLEGVNLDRFIEYDWGLNKVP